ncbi:MAG: hypothetical protein R3B07_32020 [Polyangiaceae bacterium]
MRVAIWQGKAVGVDIEAKPKNDKFVACVDERIRAGVEKTRYRA